MEKFLAKLEQNARPLTTTALFNEFHDHWIQCNECAVNLTQLSCLTGLILMSKAKEEYEKGEEDKSLLRSLEERKPSVLGV